MTERIHCQLSFFARNTKINLPDRKEMTSGGNLNPYEETKCTGKGKYLSKNRFIQICPPKDLYMNVHSSNIYNSPRVETIHMSINW